MFPEASFVYLHRDPYRVLTSFCTLLDIVNGPFVTNRDYQANLNLEESFCLNRMGRVYTRMAEFEVAHPERVLNMQYVDLLNAPVEEIARVYREAGLQSDAALEQEIQEFLTRQKKGGRAQPRQQISDHGYTRQKVENDPALHAYLQRYNVVLEPNRNTGVA